MRFEAPPRPLVIAWLIAVAAAVALSVAVTRDGQLPGEAGMLRDVQGWPFPGQMLADAVRALTTTWLIVVLGTVLAVILALSGARREALVLAAMMFALPLLQAGLKDLIDRPRPSPEIYDVRASVTSPAFPSGHVMGPAALYGFALYLAATMPWPAALRITIGALLTAILALTGIVNIWLGAHWPADVIGGYLWGFVLLLPAIAAAEST